MKKDFSKQPLKKDLLAWSPKHSKRGREKPSWGTIAPTKPYIFAARQMIASIKIAVAINFFQHIFITFHFLEPT